MSDLRCLRWGICHCADRAVELAMSGVLLMMTSRMRMVLKKQKMNFV
jgi:hypothetical protein